MIFQVEADECEGKMCCSQFHIHQQCEQKFLHVVIGYLPPLFTRERATELKYSFDTQKQHYSLSRIKGTKQENGRPVNFLQDTYGKCCTDDR